MLWYSSGDAINMAPVLEELGIALTNINQYARSVLAHATTASGSRLISE
jgi:hypothetical protein